MGRLPMLVVEGMESCPDGGACRLSLRLRRSGTGPCGSTGLGNTGGSMGDGVACNTEGSSEGTKGDGGDFVASMATTPTVKGAVVVELLLDTETLRDAAVPSEHVDGAVVASRRTLFV